MALTSPLLTQAFSGTLTFHNLIRYKLYLGLEIKCELLSLRYVTLQAHKCHLVACRFKSKSNTLNSRAECTSLYVSLYSLKPEDYSWI